MCDYTNEDNLKQYYFTSIINLHIMFFACLRACGLKDTVACVPFGMHRYTSFKPTAPLIGGLFMPVLTISSKQPFFGNSKY